ncbi:MAG: ABC transporter permease, partial [Planctomycetota bacterium]
MYKLVLCLRYLRTRWIALVPIVSVTLGVATMIVVNAVMAGFAHEMRDRLHGVLGDVVLEARSFDGVPDAETHLAKIRAAAGGDVEALAVTAQTQAMLGFTYRGERVASPVMVIGVESDSYAAVSDFGGYLQHPANRERLSFDLREGGYDAVDPQAEDPAKATRRPEMAGAGWGLRRRKAAWAKREADYAAKLRSAELRAEIESAAQTPLPLATSDPTTDPTSMEPAESATTERAAPRDPFAAAAGEPQGEVFDPAKEQHPGAVLGIALGSFRGADGNDRFLVLPGDDIELTYPMATTPPKPGSAFFTVVDFYESKMSEYDGSFVFVPLDRLQELRGLIDPATGVANFNSIQIRCKPGADLDAVRDRIAAEFDPSAYLVSTWRDKQGALLAAVQMETAVLNVLLFLIIAVAGFGILAIFYMIVVEKTR